MSYDVVDYTDVEPNAPGMHFLRDPLDCENLGVTVLEADDDRTGLEHDHAEDGQEEVYLLVEGRATLTVEGETVSLSAGDAARVDPGDTRELAFDADDSLMIIAGAP